MEFTEKEFIEEAEEVVTILNNFLLKYNKGIVGFNFTSLGHCYQVYFQLMHGRIINSKQQVDTEE
jgi:hypothetical protein